MFTGCFKNIALSLLASMCCYAGGSFAQSAYPIKPIKIIVPFGPGGIADLSTRVVAQKISESLGQGVVVENRPGAGGVAAAQAVAKSEPDGYTLLLMSNANAISASLFRSLPYDTTKDFALISLLGTFDIGIVVGADSRFKTLKELIAYAKANPNKINMGSISIGSTQNLAAELFRSESGLKFEVVPFTNTSAVVSAIRGNQVESATEILGPIASQVNAKAIRVLAVTGAKRSPFYPDVPTVTESGVGNLNASSWNALAVPAKTPPEIVAKLNKTIVAALASSDVKARLKEIYMTPQSSSPEAADKFLADEIQHWAVVIKKANIQAQ
jgi:tripartite-type tricarboxylate transporter receptor subunit TctC